MWRSKVIVIPRSRFYIAIALIFLTVLSAGSLRFGAAEVGCQVLSYAVAQKVVVIDPGHGGIDPGATGPNNTLEKDINLEIARRLAQYLSQAGAVVILTRETDNDLADEGFQGSLLERKRQDSARRLEKAQTNRAICLSVFTVMLMYRHVGPEPRCFTVITVRKERRSLSPSRVN